MIHFKRLMQKVCSRYAMFCVLRLLASLIYSLTTFESEVTILILAFVVTVDVMPPSCKYGSNGRSNIASYSNYCMFWRTDYWTLWLMAVQLLLFRSQLVPMYELNKLGFSIGVFGTVTPIALLNLVVDA